jgi:hypothetical protein
VKRRSCRGDWLGCSIIIGLMRMIVNYKYHSDKSPSKRSETVIIIIIIIIKKGGTPAEE